MGNLSKFLQIPNMHNMQSESFKYKLADTQGRPLQGCYIEILHFPSPNGARDGRALLDIDEMAGVITFNFTYNVLDGLFDAWYTDDPSMKFTMKPIFDVEDVITDLEVRFAHLPDDIVGHFTLSDVGLNWVESYFESPVETIDAMELILAPVCV